jgi:hypothetical protein
MTGGDGIVQRLIATTSISMPIRSRVPPLKGASSSAFNASVHSRFSRVLISRPESRRSNHGDVCKLADGPDADGLILESVGDGLVLESSGDRLTTGRFLVGRSIADPARQDLLGGLDGA